MNSRFLRLLWALLAAGVVIFGLLASPQLTTTHPTMGGPYVTEVTSTAWIIPAAALIALITLLTLFTTIRPALLRVPLRGLRARPALYWFILLVVITCGLGYWLALEQPTYGRWLTAVEFCYLCAFGWLLLFLLAYDLDRAAAREMGTRLGRSRLTGILVTLTTVLLIFFGAEAYLRLFYITTDGYGFTAMNYHWYKNFLWGHENSLGYRDYEPLPDDPAHPVTRIAVVGDSFANGHGIDNIDNTFPQILERELGPGYDVNLVATSGWDSDVETAYLNAYYQNLAPRLPKYVILSYYINDIDYLLKDPSVNPDAAFSFPENPTLSWFVLNFFVPNYLYYNLLQFTSPARQVDFVGRLVQGHLNDAVWAQQAATLQQMVDWCRDHNARLIILLWPHIPAVEATRPATDRVKAFFEGQGADVVDMGDVLKDRNPAELTLNRFDSHPNIAANELAAKMLFAEVRQLESGAGG